MAEKLDLSTIVPQLQHAMSAQEISQQATVLAESLSGCTVARIILANSIVRVVARSRYQSQALTQGEFISLATQASGNIVDAQGDLGKIGKPFGDYLEEEGAFLGDKIMNGTGLPLDDEHWVIPED